MEEKIQFEIKQEGGSTIRSIYKNIKESPETLFIKYEHLIDPTKQHALSANVTTYLGTPSNKDLFFISVNDTLRTHHYHGHTTSGGGDESYRYSFQSEFTSNIYEVINQLFPSDLLKVMGYI